MVTVKPARFALTSTPSMAPSSCEATLPVRAGRDVVWAATGAANDRTPASAAPVRIDESVPSFSLVISGPPYDLVEQRVECRFCPLRGDTRHAKEYGVSETKAVHHGHGARRRRHVPRLSGTGYTVFPYARKGRYEQ